MRVGMYYNNNDVRVEEMPKPAPGPGEILVKVMASGICGSDLLEWYRIRKAPLVLGHEIGGVIEEVGEGVRNLKPGDRVFVSHHVPCNTCRYCLAGHHTCCETLHTTNFFPGGFAEYVRVPPLQTERGVFLLPEEMSFEQASFIEPLGCVVRGRREARFGVAHSVLVLGSGIAGLLYIALARASGAGRIIATDISPFRLEKAREAGADVVLDAREDIPALLRAHNGGRLADRVVVCTGALQAFEQAMLSVERGGVVVCFACTEPGVNLSIPVNDFWRNSITVMSSYAAAPRDLAEAIELMRARRVDIAPLITHRLPLEKIGEAFRLAAQPDSALKVIIEPALPRQPA